MGKKKGRDEYRKKGKWYLKDLGKKGFKIYEFGSKDNSKIFPTREDAIGYMDRTKHTADSLATTKETDKLLKQRSTLTTQIDDLEASISMGSSDEAADKFTLKLAKDRLKSVNAALGYKPEEPGGPDLNVSSNKKKEGKTLIQKIFGTKKEIEEVKVKQQTKKEKQLADRTAFNWKRTRTNELTRYYRENPDKRPIDPATGKPITPRQFLKYAREQADVEYVAKLQEEQDPINILND